MGLNNVGLKSGLYWTTEWMENVKCPTKMPTKLWLYNECVRCRVHLRVYPLRRIIHNFKQNCRWGLYWLYSVHCTLYSVQCPLYIIYHYRICTRLTILVSSELVMKYSRTWISRLVQAWVPRNQIMTVDF